MHRRPPLPSGQLQLLCYALPVCYPVPSTVPYLTCPFLLGRRVKDGKAEEKHKRESYTDEHFTFHFSFVFNLGQSLGVCVSMCVCVYVYSEDSFCRIFRLLVFLG